MKTCVRPIIALTVLLWVFAASSGGTPTPAHAESGGATPRVKLWTPDQPVDILVHNPKHEPLELPAPYTPPLFSDVYGQGINEENLQSARNWESGAPAIVNVGTNITFQITYADGANEGFNDPTLGNARRVAFQFGVAIWAARLQGSAAISIIATMTPRGGNARSAVLASSGPGAFYHDFVHAPLSNTYYPEPLVEIISGSDPNTNVFDISVDYNSDVDNPVVLGNIDWYYGTDANPGSDIDFVTVTVHELCHGLGFIDTFQSNGTLTYDHPSVYDTFLVNSSGTLLTSLPPSPSNVTGNNVFWSGLLGQFAYNNDFGAGGYVPIFAPTPWRGGSSISHLDEGTFSGAWELETPNYSSAVHVPDPIVMGILQDIGHSLPASRYAAHRPPGFEDGSNANPFDTVTEAVTAVPTGGFVRIRVGDYPETMTINRAMELHSSGGTATIGASGFGARR